MYGSVLGRWAFVSEMGCGIGGVQGRKYRGETGHLVPNRMKRGCEGVPGGWGKIMDGFYFWRPGICVVDFVADGAAETAAGEGGGWW